MIIISHYILIKIIFFLFFVKYCYFYCNKKGYKKHLKKIEIRLRIWSAVREEQEIDDYFCYKSLLSLLMLKSFPSSSFRENNIHKITNLVYLVQPFILEIYYCSTKYIMNNENNCCNSSKTTSFRIYRFSSVYYFKQKQKQLNINFNWNISGNIFNTFLFLFLNCIIYSI